MAAIVGTVEVLDTLQTKAMSLPAWDNRRDFYLSAAIVILRTGFQWTDAGF